MHFIMNILDFFNMMFFIYYLSYRYMNKFGWASFLEKLYGFIMFSVGSILAEVWWDTVSVKMFIGCLMK